MPTSTDEAIHDEEDLDQDWVVEDDSHELTLTLNVSDHVVLLADPNDPNLKVQLSSLCCYA